MNDPANNHSGVSLQVRGLRKSFDGQEVLKGIDFEVKPGEIFVIMGPSGSGKSVLLKHLIGLEPPDAGEILINGESIQTPEIADKYRLAMVFQSGALLNSLTVGENVGLYLSEHRLKPPEEIARIVAEKLEDVGLKDAGDKMPGDLSGGMKKRAAIARALVIEPQLILYDEPTSELDPLSAVVIGEEILELNKRIHVTSLVVSHDRDLAFGIADRIAVINEGRILTIGTPDEVKRFQRPARPEIFERRLQTRNQIKPMKNSLETRLGIFVILVVLAAWAIMETLGGLQMFQGGYRVNALFNSAQDLKVGDNVKMAGVEIGRVEKIALDQSERQCHHETPLGRHRQDGQQGERQVHRPDGAEFRVHQFWLHRRAQSGGWDVSANRRAARSQRGHGQAE